MPEVIGDLRRAPAKFENPDFSYKHYATDHPKKETKKANQQNKQKKVAFT